MRKRSIKVAVAVAAAGVSIGGLAAAFNPMAQAASGEVMNVGGAVGAGEYVEANLGWWYSEYECGRGMTVYVKESLNNDRYSESRDRFYAYRCDQKDDYNGHEVWAGTAIGERVLNGAYYPDGTKIGDNDTATGGVDATLTPTSPPNSLESPNSDEPKNSAEPKNEGDNQD